MTLKKCKGDWKDVEFDNEGNVVSMRKLKPSSLPKDM